MSQLTRLTTALVASLAAAIALTLAAADAESNDLEPQGAAPTSSTPGDGGLSG